MSSRETVEVEVVERVATVTLNRPEVLNAFNQQMLDEFSSVWQDVRLDDGVHVVVLQANGERAFSSGLDRTEGIDMPENPWSRVPPAFQLGPKTNHVFKPIVCAVHGLCAGGAFYWIAESDVVICSDDAQFFDPHTSASMTSPFVAPSLVGRIPYGEAMRMALLGLDERMPATRAHAIGLVSEVVQRAHLRDRARELALLIARKPPSVVQGTVKAAWLARFANPAAMQISGVHFSAIGNPLAAGWNPDA